LGTAPLAGENPDDTVRQLLDSRASQYLPIVSTASLADGVFLERCTIAASKADFALPCRTGLASEARLPSRIANLAPAEFDGSWNVGLTQVLSRLQALGCQPVLGAERGRQIALRDYLQTRVTVAKPEPVFANVFPLTLPQSILLFDLRRPLTDAETQALRRQWAFVELRDTRLAAFSPPPDGGIPATNVPRVPEFLWEHVPQSEGKKAIDIVKELVWRSLEVICVRKGLKFCDDRKVWYFPEREAGEWNQSITHVDGRATTVQLTGERTKGWGDRASRFLYQLGPRIRPQRDVDGTWNMVVRVYVRVTTLEGTMFEGKEIGRRRKVVTKSWWNKEWLARLLGVVQALESSKGQVEIGEGKRAVVMQTRPLSWECPVGLDVMALTGMSDIGEEIAQYRARDNDGDDEGVAPSQE